ncbi:MAG: S49 family peptidase, partial [Pseudomonadota bacterium]|nr:S49 family peptidase [Pseudomonadota bacterium]
TIAPRASAVRDASASFASLETFGKLFDEVAADPKVSAIVLNVDSPGGMVDLVPETAAKIRGARREGRPIHAVANTMACSAAYWIASQADRLFASPSAVVGSIGVRAAHMDQSAYMAKLGVKVTQISAGARKTEGNPYEPLDAAARKALQEEIDAAYAMFVADVAAARGVSAEVVSADPEKAARHMGGGRAYGASRALQLGMVDGIATLAEVIAGVSGGRSARMERERLALL